MDPDTLEARAREAYPTLRNRAMARKLVQGRALDVRTMMLQVEPATATHRWWPDGALIFTLREYVDNKDYCDVETERWIWSIGRCLLDGRILASTDLRFYENPDFECLWLR